MAQWRKSSTRFSSSGPAKRVVGFHRVAADGFGHGVFAEPRQIHLAPGGAQFVHEIKDKPPRVAHLHKRRQRVEQKRPFAKFVQAHAQPRERSQLLAQKLARRAAAVQSSPAAAIFATARRRSIRCGSSSARTKSARAPRAGPAAPVRGRIPARHKVCR